MPADVELRNQYAPTVNKGHVKINRCVVVFTCAKMLFKSSEGEERAPSCGSGEEANFGLLLFFVRSNQCIISSCILTCWLVDVSSQKNRPMEVWPDSWSQPMTS